ncbi:MAG: glycosyltransferase [Candidatus Anammoxibacter sp.]
MLSIIIPTFNEETYLPKLLQSIRIQKDVDYEIIVADNNSTDNTRKIAKQYGCKIVDGGSPARGRNNGARSSKEEILLFLDADVILDKNFLKAIINEYSRKNLGTATCLVHPLSNKIFDIILHLIANVGIKLSEKTSHPRAAGFCILTKNSIFSEIDGFNESLVMAEDHDFVKRAKEIGTFGILSCRKIKVSVRRLEKEGRLGLLIKYFLVELKLAQKKEITSDMFEYKYGNHET